VLGEVQQSRMEHRVAAVVVLQPDRLHAVVQDLLGDAAQIVEGVLVTAQQRRQSLRVTEIEKAGARPAQRQHEGLHPFPLRLAESSPVGLRLFAGRRLKADRRPVCEQRAERMQELPENAAATRVALGANLIEEHRGVAHLVLQQPLQQVIPKGIQFRAHQEWGPRPRHLALDQPAHSFPVASGQARNLTEALACPPQVSNVQILFRPDQPRYLLLQRWLRQDQPSHLRLGTFKPWIALSPSPSGEFQTVATWGFSHRGWHYELAAKDSPAYRYMLLLPPPIHG